MAYATLAQFFRFGLRAAALVPQPRTVAAVDATGDTLALPMHGLTTADLVRVQVSPGGALPAPLTASTDYYAIAISDDLFKLATSSANALANIWIDLTTAGTGTIGLTASVKQLILDQLEVDAATINGALKCYGTPLLAPIPLEVVKCNAHLSAFNVATTLGLLNPSQPTQDIENVKARHDLAQAALERWRAGENLPGPPVDSTPATTEEPAIGWGDPIRCWSPGGII
jgi:hypothetical protein